METNIVIRNGVEFLLFTYFGLSYEDSKKTELIIRTAVEFAYKDATNQGAFNALFTKSAFPDRNRVNSFKNCVKGMSDIITRAVSALYFGCCSIDFDKWHEALCGELIKEYQEICKKNNLMVCEFFTYGNAQKWVNMTIKNLYVISGAYLAMEVTENKEFFENVASSSEKYHVPLDNLILGEIYKQQLTSNQNQYYVTKHGKKDPNYRITSKAGSYVWSCIPCYNTYKTFRETLEKAIQEPAIEWECKNWIERKKQIKARKGDLTTIDEKE
ncbi:MAG: hypothetical protein IKQ56_01165 [Lachnospiraceae bacterium]|nr:hypothetical protein [Lachnospiraceae bacterium]